MSSRASTWASHGRPVELVTTPADDGDAVKAYYGIDGAEFTSLKPVDRFLAATGLLGPRAGGTAVRPAERQRPPTGHQRPGSPSGRWRPPSSSTRASARDGERRGGRARLGRRGVRAVAVVRPGQPVRPARPRRRAAVHRARPRAADPVRQRPEPRRTRTLAVVQYLASIAGRCRVDVACSLVAPMDTLGIGDGDAPADLFDRTFNGRGPRRSRARSFAAPRSSRGPTAATGCSPARATSSRRATPSSVDGSSVRWACPRPTSPRSCSSSAGTTEALEETGPFDGDEIGLQALSLLHRVARLTCALGLAPDELFAVLDALSGDPSIRGRNTFDLLIDTPPREPDCYRILAGGYRRRRALARADPRRRRPLDAGDATSTAPSSTRSSAGPRPAGAGGRAPGRRGRRARRALPAVPGRAAGTARSSSPTGSTSGPRGSSTTC